MSRVSKWESVRVSEWESASLQVFQVPSFCLTFRQFFWINSYISMCMLADSQWVHVFSLHPFPHHHSREIDRDLGGKCPGHKLAVVIACMKINSKAGTFTYQPSIAMSSWVFPTKTMTIGGKGLGQKRAGGRARKYIHMIECAQECKHRQPETVKV